ncbi:thiolase family protein, partial [Nonomuraea wenchangensis]
MADDVYIVSAVRTPHGKYGGSLKDVRLVDLGGLAGRAALDRAGVSPADIGELVLSNCRQAGNGPNPGRQVALKAGLPEPVPAQTVNMACASGLKALQLAAQSIVLGDGGLALAVAAESMSTMPYLAPYTLRWGGVRRGDVTLADGWTDGGTDPICGMTMGQTAEKVARVHGVSRADQDAWSARSHRRLSAAW